jgi:hypothetical protein
MRFYLDTEFNGFGGELISIALVTQFLRGAQYTSYQIIKPSADRILDPWVADNVIPHLRVESTDQGHEVTPDEAGARLAAIFAEYGHVEIYADWPADFEHLCALLARHGKNMGFSYCPNMTFRLVPTPDLTFWRSGTQHNALDDAMTLQRWNECQLEALADMCGLEGEDRPI